jgi:hypothetical protein
LSLRSGVVLADLEEVAVRVAEEAAYLVAVLRGVRWCQEFGAAIGEGVIDATAIGDSDREGGADVFGVRGRSHADRGLVRGWAARRNEEQPAAEELVNGGRAAVFAEKGSTEDAGVEVLRGFDVADDEDVVSGAFGSGKVTSEIDATLRDRFIGKAR